MARKPRIDYPGAIHHVMTRGANRQSIFLNDLDRDLLITIWVEAVKRFGIEVISFTWMTNHVHLVVRTPEAQLSATMQFVNRSYTQQFNHHHRRDGARHRGRFNSILVDTDQYFDQCTRYVHLNPVVANTVAIEDLDRYPWSSYRDYVGPASLRRSFIQVSSGLTNFGSPSAYRSFVEGEFLDPLVDRFYRQPIASGRVLGTQEFVRSVAQHLGEDPQTSGLKAGIPTTTIEQVSESVIKLFGCPPSDLITSKRNNTPRKVALRLARDLADATTAEVRDHYGFASNSAARIAVDAAEHHDRDVERAYAELSASLSAFRGLGGFRW